MGNAGRPGCEAARKALARGDVDAAVHRAKRYLLDNPEDPEGLRILFEALQKSGRPDEACLVGRRLVEAAPTDLEARLGTARLELRQGRSDRVIRMLQEHVGDDRVATALLAKAYEEAGKSVLAERLRVSLRGAEWMGGDLPESDHQRRYFARQLSFLLEQYADPNASVRELIEQLEEGRYAQAASSFKAWVDARQDEVGSLALADWLMLSGKPEQARDVLMRSEPEGDLRGAWENRAGDLAQMEDRYDDARSHYRKATVVDPADANAWLDLARTEFLRGDRSAAAEACRKVLSIEERGEEFWLAEEYLRELEADADRGRPESGLYGLVWWERGGGLLEIEVARRKESSGLMITGNLGQHLEDAARVAYRFVQSRTGGLQAEGAHLHFPGFRTPKDGGSAGLLLGVVLYGALHRHDAEDRVAMTGELTLEGQVMPVGGIREKITSAHLHGMDRVILPAGNTDDLIRVPLAAKRSLDFVRVRHFSEAVTALGWQA